MNMTTLDRASFEEILASAYAVQRSGLDRLSLSALVDLQRSIITGEVDLDRAMHRVADRARNVANATGTAVALFKADQLECRAGSGSAAAYVGRHIIAVLSVSEHNEARNEILRVENAESDTRIEGAVCRQFGANALLILPIYREHVIAGVLEVSFREAHTFHDREVRVYRAMARLLEEAISRDTPPEQKKVPAEQSITVSHSIDGTREPPVKAATITHTLKQVPLSSLRWNVVAVGIVILLTILNWLAYDHHPGSLMNSSLPPRSNVTTVQRAPAEPSRAYKLTPRPQFSLHGTEHRDAARPAFKIIRMGQNEVDYVAEDVTIRRFRSTPALQMRVAEKRIDFGEDVTVRYFESKTPVVQKTQPASVAARSIER